jgi:flagellar protein FlaG
VDTSVNINRIVVNNTLPSKPDNNIDANVKQSRTDDSIKAAKKVDGKELKHAVDRANNVLFKNNTHLQFKIHDVTKDVMVKIVDDETGDVIKEIPPEKMLDLVAKIWEIAGIIVDEKR